MGWGKVVLIFQAIITIVLGGLFFVSSFDFDSEVQTGISDEGFRFNEFRNTFETGSYILLTIAFIELIIISRFV